MENPIKMDDLGVHLFLETSISFRPLFSFFPLRGFLIVHWTRSGGNTTAVVSSASYSRERQFRRSMRCLRVSYISLFACFRENRSGAGKSFFKIFSTSLRFVYPIGSMYGKYTKIYLLIYHRNQASMDR